MLTRVRSVGIYVSDQQRALEFFTEVLGCELVVDEPMGSEPGSPRWIEVKIPGNDTLLVLFTPDGQNERDRDVLERPLPLRRHAGHVRAS